MSNLSTAILALTPKGYWRLNDALGAATAVDSSGNSHTGTFGSSVKPGMPGLGQVAQTAARWPGATSNNAVTVSSSADFNSAAVSIVMAFRMDQWLRGISLSDFWLTASGSWGGGFAYSAGNGLQMNFSRSGVAGVCSATSYINDTNQWHLCVWTTDGSSSWKLWLDGVDVTGTVTPQTPTLANTFQFGGDYQPCQAQDVAFFNKQLSSTDVANLKAAFDADNTVTAQSVLWGIHNDATYSTGGRIDSQIATTANTHGRISRNSLLWNVIQTSSGGAYDWSRHDQIVNDCNQKGVIPWFVFVGSPTWANGGSSTTDVPGVGADATFQAWVTKCQTFIGDFVDRYKPGGSGTYTIPDPFWIELWNEPNLDGFWHNTSVNTTQQKADQYAYWYKNIRSTILAHYSTAKVTMAGIASLGAAGAPDITGETFVRDVLGSTQWLDAGTAYTAPVLADSPSGYWRLDDASGATAVDSSGNSRNGSYTGTVTYGASSLLTSDPDKAITLPGTATNYVGLPSSSWTNSSTWSIEVWFKTSSSSSKIVGMRCSTDSNPIVQMAVDSAGKLQWGLRTDAATLSVVSSGTTVNNNARHHGVLTFDGTNARLYCDGSLVLGPTSLGAGSTFFNVSTPDQMSLGVDLGGGGAASGWMAGTVDEAAIYGTTLSAARVSAHYAAGVASPPTAPPIDYAALHPYTYQDNPDAVTYGQNSFNDTLTFRCILAELGYGASPICLTEWGMSDATSQADQASKISAAMTRVRDEWSTFVPVSVTFCDDDQTTLHYGLYTSIPTDGTASTASKTAATTYAGIAPAFPAGGGSSTLASSYSGAAFLHMKGIR